MTKEFTWEDYKNQLKADPAKRDLVKESENIASVINDIIAKRKSAGMTQKELAEKTSLTQSYIARIEKCSVMPRLDTLAKIWAVLNVEPYTKEQDSYVFTLTAETVPILCQIGLTIAVSVGANGSLNKRVVI